MHAWIKCRDISVPAVRLWRTDQHQKRFHSQNQPPPTNPEWDWAGEGNTWDYPEFQLSFTATSSGRVMCLDIWPGHNFRSIRGRHRGTFTKSALLIFLLSPPSGDLRAVQMLSSLSSKYLIVVGFLSLSLLLETRETREAIQVPAPKARFTTRVL